MPGLRDVLANDLLVVFCGTAVGVDSASRNAYYANPGNKFWPVLHTMGLTPRVLSPDECWQAPAYGFGLTDLAKSAVGADHALAEDDFDVAAFKRKMRRRKPRFIAFTSLRAAEEYFGSSVECGLQDERLGESQIYILNSTSGVASAHWNNGRHWKALGRLLKSLDRVA